MNSKQPLVAFLLAFCLIIGEGCGPSDESTEGNPQLSPVVTKVEKDSNGNWQLIRDGKPFTVKGAGGDGPLSLLAESGGNSNRTWGVGPETRRRLDEAHENGLTVCVGIWLEHERHGFSYDDEAAVKKQERMVLDAVQQHKDHPAVLIWGIGNEMEGYESGDDPRIWNHIEKVAAQVKKADPNHPTMTVIAEIGGKRIESIHKYCPSIDIIGVNSYGGAASLPERYRAAGGTKPYIVTEFGPNGTWEVPRNEVDAIIEPNSTVKAEQYKKSYESISSDKNCLGSYAFLWGNKQEATPTWFGMLLPDGKKTAAVDIMTQLWSGQPAADLCPEITSLELKGKNFVTYEDTVEFSLAASDPEGKPINVRWELMSDKEDNLTGGDFRPAPPSFPTAVIESSNTHAKVKAPNIDGLYRLYAFVDDGNGAATANIPIRIGMGELEEPGRKVELPYVVYDEPKEAADYAPSGWMGDAASIVVDEESTEQPKNGAHCIKCEFTNREHWGGVVWQNPPEDWGEQPGGLDLRGATKLTFWARCGSDELDIKFGVGVLGRDKPYFDTVKVELPFKLTTEWQQFTIDLSKYDLQRVKSGFFWSVAGQGKPIAFYLDDIVFE